MSHACAPPRSISVCKLSVVFAGGSRGIPRVQSSKKLTDAQMLEIGPLLKKGWTFVAAFREVIERLTPDDEIRALHTRAVANGGNWCLLSVGNFGHVVVWGAEKDRTLAKVKDTLAGLSAPQRF